MQSAPIPSLADIQAQIKATCAELHETCVVINSVLGRKAEKPKKTSKRKEANPN